MRRSPHASHLTAAVIGGAVVAGALLALGVTGHRTVQTVIEQAPVEAAPAAHSLALTPHAIYLRDAPAVVHVQSTVGAAVPGPFPASPVGTTTSASGFLIDHGGHILTHYAAVAGAQRVQVTFGENIVRPATVVGVDAGDDLALLRADMTGVPRIAPLALAGWADSSVVRVGDPTLMIANSFGGDRALATAIVSSLARQLTAANGYTVQNVIETDVDMPANAAGGPLLDAAGRVIGVQAVLPVSTQQGAESVPFAVPSDTVAAAIGRLEAPPAAVPYLGLTTTARPADGGLMVDSVAPGGPAATGGIDRGEVIEQVSGRAVRSPGQLASIIDATQPGQRLRVRILHGHHARTLGVEVGRRPPGGQGT